ncbi:MAG: tetratricopeptide repeat protein [Rhizomicrobium sp.]
MSQKTTSPSSFRDRFESANRLWEAQRFPEAENAYLELLTEDPSSSAAASRLGDIRLALGDMDGARAYFTRAIAINSKLPWGYAGLGRIAEKSGDLEAALNHSKRALELSPGSRWLSDRIGALTARLSKTRPSKDSPETQAAFRRRFEQANDLLANHQLAEAEAIYRELLDREPNSAPLLCKLGEIEAESGRVADAKACYDRAIAINRDFPWAYIGQSEILEATGDLDAAIHALRIVTKLDSSLSFVEERIQALRRKQRLETERLTGGVRIRHWPADPRLETAVAGKTPLPRVAIVAWDLAHNPVGRALTLAEIARRHANCEIVGPVFTEHGEDLWPPLRESERPFGIRGFHAYSFSSFLEGAIRLVAEKPCDVAWVSKPCMPSLLIGFLYKLIHGASILLDIDDDELAIVGADGPLTLDGFIEKCSAFDWSEPFSKHWTQLAASMMEFVDGITVCNAVLQHKFGGILLRHARDPKTFDAALAKRATVRAEFGFSDTDKVILFLGTPRKHKGLLEIAKALQVIGDPCAVLCIIGTVLDPSFKKELEALKPTRIVFHPDQPYSRVAELNAMADLVCVLQDAADPIAAFQTPAKLTDALAVGTVVLATPVPPISAFSGKYGSAEAAEARRALFRAELTTDANAGRALEAIQIARNKKSPVPADILRLLRYVDASMPGQLHQECADALKDVLHTGPRIGKLRTLSEDVNLVFFWKQNDTGIFGRRQDMLLAQFAAMPRIKRILHIDAPISADVLNSLARSGGGRELTQGGLVAANTVARHLRTLDDDRVFRRTLIYRGKETSLFGQELPDIQSFPNAVESWLRELDMTENVLAWVCPIVPYFPEVQKRLGFSFVVADVIDDQRTWPMRLGSRVQIERSYRETFACTDAAFANCRPVCEWLAEQGLTANIVPNGVDVRSDVEDWEIPAALRYLKRPIVGYAGNLSHRIDWDLIEKIAASRPDWSIVIIGETPANDRYRRLASRPNVHAMGVIPYETALRYIASFDVAMIPHVRSAMSEKMNPLKLYVYRGLGVPVVSSALANLDDLAGDIRVADSADQFVARLEEAIAERQNRGRSYPTADLLRAYSWESRMASILDHIDEVFRARQSSTNAGIAA